MFQTGLQQDYTVSVSNATEKTSQYYSLNWADRDGIITGDKYTKNLRNNGRIRVKFDKWLVHIPFLCYLTILLISAEGAVYGGY